MDYINQPAAQAAPKSSGKMKWVLIGLAALLAIIAIWYFTAGKNGRVLGASTTSGYQAVFLTNGQVYFGKLADRGDWIELTDIFYLQVTQNLQAAGSGDQNTAATPATDDNKQSNIQLVKLGSELHGPEDRMNIMRDKVLFWENMKDDSKVVSAIKQYKNK